jgi:hypothetical protein
VQLTISEFLNGLNVARSGHNFHVAIFNFPSGRTSIFDADPFRQIFAVKKDDGVRRWLARRLLRAKPSRAKSRVAAGGCCRAPAT